MCDATSAQVDERFAILDYVDMVRNPDPATAPPTQPSMETGTDRIQKAGMTVLLSLLVVTIFIVPLVAAPFGIQDGHGLSSSSCCCF